jgi:hypothetical protein
LLGRPLPAGAVNRFFPARSRLGGLNSGLTANRTFFSVFLQQFIWPVPGILLTVNHGNKEPIMPRRSNPFETLFAAKQHQALANVVIEALREGATLTMALADFADGVSALRKTGADLTGVKLGDLFSGIVAKGEPIGRPRGRVGRPPASAAAPVVRRGPGRPRKDAAAPVAKPAKGKKTGKKPGRKPGVRSELIVKRLDAVVAVLKKGGDWMRTAEIYQAVHKQGDLFKGLEPIHVTQLLARLVEEKPARIEKTGQRGASRYRAV